MLSITPFQENQKTEVIELIVGIQQGEFGLSITAREQPDLSEIPAFYQAGKGNFWVAEIQTDDLPHAFPIMAVDSRFYTYAV